MHIGAVRDVVVTGLDAPAATRTGERRRLWVARHVGDGPACVESDLERAEEADVAFAGLFLLPNGVATRAEAWLGPGGGRPLRSSVAQALQALGREVTQEQGRLPLDHASLLFDLAAHLLREMPPDELLAADLLDPWTRRFAEALSAAEAPRLYVALGHLLATLHPSPPERGAQPS